MNAKCISCHGKRNATKGINSNKLFHDLHLSLRRCAWLVGWLVDVWLFGVCLVLYGTGGSQLVSSKSPVQGISLQNLKTEAKCG